MSQLPRLLASCIATTAAALVAASSAWACLSEWEEERSEKLSSGACRSPGVEEENWRTIRESSTFGDAEFAVYGDIGPRLLCVSWRGEFVLAMSDVWFEIAPDDVWQSIPGRAFGPTEDLTGDGLQNVVVFHYTGGAHCCHDYLIFSLEEDGPRCLDVVGGWDHPVKFAPLDEGPGFAVIEPENVFAYWKTSFASSPAPNLILRFGGGKFLADAELMRAPPPPTTELQRLAHEVRASPAWETRLEPHLWKVMLDLIYTGNADFAGEFFEAAWPANRAGKKDFAREFLECQLRHSIYWETIRKLNDLSEGEPLGDCPGYQ